MKNQNNRKLSTLQRKKFNKIHKKHKYKSLNKRINKMFLNQPNKRLLSMVKKFSKSTFLKMNQRIIKR